MAGRMIVGGGVAALAGVAVTTVTSSGVAGLLAAVVLWTWAVAR